MSVDDSPQFVNVPKPNRAHSSAPTATIDCEDGDDCFTFKPSNSPRRVHVVPITFTAPEKEGRIVEHIRITTEGAAGKLPAVVAQAEVRDP